MIALALSGAVVAQQLTQPNPLPLPLTNHQIKPINQHAPRYLPQFPQPAWFSPTNSTSSRDRTERLCNMGSETVMVHEISFPTKVTTSKPLSLFGHGITDIEIHFLQIKFTAIGVYLDPEVIAHLHQWKGKSGTALAGDDDFFEALISAPVEKFLRIVVIKEIKGSQYGVQLESAVRDRLAAEDKYEEEEEVELEKVVEFFQSKYFKKDSVITFHFPAASKMAEVTFSTEGKEEAKIVLGNGNLVEMIQRWYLGGTRGVSQTTISSLAENLSSELSK
ncbi:hypothetical protein MLD38_024108 [Melastoma candidum]|uniref:Uncharacterized protein n=1 Tax=Melastoma candidum TaxID=119954 RepID=A0ACB9NTX9_9MYRT|nr:hypothetical protein MLD38_024108 [Melastoma candidum]